VVVESHDDFPGVEISIAGGVGEMVRANPMALTSEVYRVWNRAKDEIVDAGNIELSEKSIHIISLVSYHQIYTLVLTTSDTSKYTSMRA